MILLALVLVSAPPFASRSVAQLTRDHVAYTGRRVRGWLTAPCYKFGCALSATRDGKGDHVSLGSSVEFDRTVVGAVGRELVVEVTVTDRCWPTPPGSDDIVVCTDRGDQVADPRLVRILP